MENKKEVILVIAPPFGPEGPPMGLACLGAHLEANGVSVGMFDANIRLLGDTAQDRKSWWSPDAKARWVYPTVIGRTYEALAEHLDRYVRELAETRAPFYGFSVHSDNRLCTIEMMKRLRLIRPDAKMIVGGMGVSSLSERVAFGKGLVDYFVIGEGEVTLLELLQARDRGKEPSEIPGVSAWNGSFYTEHEPRPWAKDLDGFAYPSFDGFDLSRYSTPNLPVLTSRGCIKGCVICNDRVLMGKYRRKSGENIFAEVMHHVLVLGIHDFMFNDLQINANLEQVDLFCSKIVASGEKIRWNANAVVDDAITADLLKNMAAAGCHTLCLGLESGSQKVVKDMNKGFVIDQAIRLMGDIKAAGITLWINLVIGFPTETEEDFGQSLDFVRTHADFIDEVAVLNTCNILDHSILARRIDRYNVAEPVDPDWFEVNWETRDGLNTLEIRTDRQRRMIELTKELGIPVRQTNFSFEDEDAFRTRESHDLAMVLAPPFDVEMPPWEMARAAGYLDKNGLSAFGLDLNIETFKHADEKSRALWRLEMHDTWAHEPTFEKYVARLGLDFDRIANRIGAVNAPMIYFHVVRGNLLFLRRLAKKIREKFPDRILIYGGSSTRITAERDLLTSDIADYFVLGDPEPSLLDLVERLKENRSLAHIRGVMYVKPDGDRHYIPRQPVRDLDRLGYPSFREFKPNRYISPKLPICISRGCAHRCAFCSEQPEQGPFRTRSARLVFDEMASHYETWDVFTFEFRDLVIDCDLPVLEELCDLITKSRYPFLWSGQMAPGSDLTPALFEKMKAAGATALAFGVESFSDPILISMNKTYTSVDAIRNLRDAHQAGIETHLNLMVGFPGEENEHFYATARAIKENVDYIDFVDTISSCYISPGSLLEANQKRWGVFLPEGHHHDAWDQRGRNNRSWREKRRKEMAVFIASLPIKFNYDFFVPPHHSFRKMEDRIRERFAQRMKPKPEIILATVPPWGYENPPVGLAYLSTYLKKHGVPCEVLDFNIRFYNKVFDIYKLLWHVENKNYWSNEQTYKVVQYSLNELIDLAVEEMLDVNPPAIGFSVVDPKERMTIDFIQRLRQRNYKGRIILGGPACHTPDYRQVFIDNAGDYIDGYCIGEGEETLLDACLKIRVGQDLCDTPGLLTLDETGECRYEPRAFIADLDSIPHPTYEEFDFEKYPGDSLILEWSRGCVGTCTFCKGREIAGPYRSRSAKHIFDELKHHYYKNGYDNFTICDPLINGSPEIMTDLCDMIVAEGLPIRWNGEGIPLATLDPEMLSKMKAAGCYELQLGVECGSEAVLKKMGKLRLFNMEDAQNAVRNCHNAGIKTCVFIIVGFPGETEQDFARTLSFIDTNAPWIDQIKSINSMHVITDTPVHKHAEKFGLTLPENDYHYLWSDANGMDWPERNKRIRRVLAVCEKHGIEVRETNLTEGKQLDLAEEICAGDQPIEKQMERMIRQINELRSFEIGDAKALPDPPISRSNVPEEPAEITAEPPADFESEKAKDEFVAEHLQLAGAMDGHEVFAGPELLEIDLTNACNLNCVGCWNHSDLLGEDKFSGEKFKRRLPTQVILDAIDRAAAMGAKRVQLSGAGEPFMHPDIMEIIKKVKGHGLHCTLISNFTLVDEKKAGALVDLGVDAVTVSVWAGTPKMYEKTHPNTKGTTLYRIRDMLRLIHDLKNEKKTYLPQVKIYNVISRINAGGITDMVDFALSCLADTIEFTPIDIIPGKTDSLALDQQARDLIAEQLQAFPKRKDYLELDPTQGQSENRGSAEGKEFARFIKAELLSDRFRYELTDISKFDVLCPRKEWRLDVKEDNQLENALLFYYPEKECVICPEAGKCPIDKDRYAVKVEFLSILGFGSFYRRITSPAADTGRYDSIVREMPCLAGWTYARILTDGGVIPCCKADGLPLGNLSDKNFGEIWADGPYREFREKAKTLCKDDPYFAPIGCLNACDNLGQNLKTLEELKNLRAHEKSALESVKDGGPKKL